MPYMKTIKLPEDFIFRCKNVLYASISGFLLVLHSGLDSVEHGKALARLVLHYMGVL